MYLHCSYLRFRWMSPDVSKVNFFETLVCCYTYFVAIAGGIDTSELYRYQSTVS
jgi:aminoglycoside N3'-acetyltransferase